ncbi:hypothetical protein CDIK_0993 [Cucumispora dikerogammari]|nr:hypothetical protein CDIK_0993 [Cucumispora dikerogammari]
MFFAQNILILKQLFCSEIEEQTTKITEPNIVNDDKKHSRVYNHASFNAINVAIIEKIKELNKKRALAKASILRLINNRDNISEFDQDLQNIKSISDKYESEFLYLTEFYTEFNNFEKCSFEICIRHIEFKISFFSNIVNVSEPCVRLVYDTHYFLYITKGFIITKYNEKKLNGPIIQLLVNWYNFHLTRFNAYLEELKILNKLINKE